MSRPARPRSNCNPSRAVNPPQVGVHTPGATEGSNESMSQERYTGRSFLPSCRSPCPADPPRGPPAPPVVAHGDHIVAKRAGVIHHARPVGRAADADMIGRARGNPLL